MVLDMKLAEDLSIAEQQNEFLERFRERKEGGKHPGREGRGKGVQFRAA